MKTPKLNEVQGQHTPTPWITENLNPFILGPDENAVCQMTWGKRPMAEEKANAAFIVRAVNAHEELIAAGKEAMSIMLRNTLQDAKDTSVYHRLKEAIARAEGKV